MRARLKRLILLALAQCDGVPMPEDALLNGVQVMARHESPTRADVEIALREAEAAGLAQGLTDELTGRSWTLTEKGKHKATQVA